MKALTMALCLLLCSFSLAPAQTRTRRTTQRRRAPAASGSARLDQTRFNTQRLQLANLSKDLTRFLYLYGRLSKDLELTSAQSQSADVSSKAKAALIQNMQTMRDRLDQLEGQFRFAQGLERQSQMLQGVSARADEAVQNVSANRFDQAGRILLDIATQLTDVLLEM